MPHAPHAVLLVGAWEGQRAPVSCTARFMHIIVLLALVLLVHYVHAIS
jgi:hypothetical protein